MKIPLGLKTLKELDNEKIVHAFDHELGYAVRDCLDRPTDDRARTVTLTMTLRPDESDGVAETVSADFTVKCKVPARQSKTFQLGVHGSGKVLVNPASPESVYQGTLDEVNETKGADAE